MQQEHLLIEPNIDPVPKYFMKQIQTNFLTTNVLNYMKYPPTALNSTS
jgi:hypothetical protein